MTTGVWPGEARIEVRDDGVYAVVGTTRAPHGNGVERNVEVAGELPESELQKLREVLE